MILYCALAVITCLFAYPVVSPGMLANSTQSDENQFHFRQSRQQVLNGVCIAVLFLLLFAVSALREGVGIDYGTYVRNFNAVYYDAYVVTEAGYNFLVKAMYAIGGDGNYYLVFALFSFLTVAVFLRAIYKQSDWFAMSFFLYMTLGLYFIAFSTMRYYLVLGFAFLLMKDVCDKRFVKFIVSVLILFLFHKSVLIVIPIYLLARIPWKKWQLALITLFALSALVFEDFYMKILLTLYPTYHDTAYLEGGTSYISILRCVAVIVLALLYYKPAIKDNVENRFYLTLNYFALLLYTCGSFIPVISRIGYYMMISQVLLIPGILVKIPDKRQKRFFTAMVILACVLYFALFLHNCSDQSLRLLPYRTWFFEKIGII